MKKSILMLACALVASSAGAQNLNGAGATFPAPIYQKWFSEYSASHKGVEINYQPIGSGGGIRQVLAGTVDFGATDGPMSDEQMNSATIKVFHVPTVLGAVVPIYNIPGVGDDLKFSPDVLADIYLGKIAKWNDARIAKDNPGVKLPDTGIITVHRADGSGTTYIFTDYLSKVSAAWKSGPRQGNIDFLAGRLWGQPGRQGQRRCLRNGQADSRLDRLRGTDLRGAEQDSVRPDQECSGQWVKASVDGVTAAAAASVKQMPDDFRVSITDAPGKASYPISSFTWLLVPMVSKDPAKGAVLKDFLNWMLDHGESEVSDLYYAPLPKSVQVKVRGAIKYFK